MTTNELVTLIASYVGASWTRQAILEALNRAQNEILGTDNDISRVKPDPFLATAATTYVYAASSTLYVSATGAQGALVGDIRAVRKIWTPQMSFSLFPLQALDIHLAKYYHVDHDKIRVYADFIDSIEPSSSDCSIRWPAGYDPGATTITWQAEAYAWPTQLTAETIALTMPADFHDDLLLPGTLKRLEPREYGQPGANLTLYRQAHSRFKTKYTGTPNQGGPLEARSLNC